MSRQGRKTPFLKDTLTKHAAGKVERRAKIALFTGIGIGLAAAVFALLYLANFATILGDLLPVLVQATMIPLIIVTFYLIGVLDADEDIYKDKRVARQRDLFNSDEVDKDDNKGK